MNQNKQEQIDKIKVSLKGELDSSNVDGDILYYNELSRGRVLNRLYKLFSKELAKVEQRVRDEEREHIIDSIIKVSSKYWIDKHIGVPAPIVVNATRFKKFVLHELTPPTTNERND